MSTENDIDLWLAFPPLVETNFGSFFPSTAVLAAYLEDKGIHVEQADLNEEFALWLLRPDILDEAATLRPGSSSAAASRWLARCRDRLFDAEGRHDFGPNSPYGAVLQLLAQQYLVDPDENVLDHGDSCAALAVHYERFYDQAGLDGRVPASVPLIGISVPMGPQLLPALTLATRLRALRPGVPIVFGGPALSLMSPPEIERLLTAWDAVDAVVRFDGERPLHELAAQAKQGRWEPWTVAGVSCRTDGIDGTVRHNDPGVGLPVNLLPAPLYPPSAVASLADPALGVTQARGCYWGRCDYCDFIELYDGSPPFRGRHPRGFVAELKDLSRRYGVTRFNFITESIPPAFARKVCAALIEERLNFRWASFAMVDRRFDRELLASMVEAGCEFLVIGMETTITRVLKLVHKSADREENLRFLRDAREAGLPLVVNLIPDLPTTTYDEAMTALADVAEFADAIRSVSVFPFEPTRSSNVGRNPERFGFDVSVASTSSGQAQYALNHLVATDPAMTPEQRAEVHAAYRKFADGINGRAGRTPIGTPGPDDRLRVPAEDLDLFPSEAGLVCTNLRTRSRAVIPRRAADLLGTYLDGTPFSRRTMRDRYSPEVADRLLDNLNAADLLVRLPDTELVSHG